METALKESVGLGRALTVSLVNGELEREVNGRLREKAKTAQLAGFRKGHAPAHVIERHYGADVRREALQKLIGDSLTDALTERKLRPAMTPRVEDARIENGAVHYTASFEVLPDVALVPADRLDIEKPECDIGETDVDAGLEKLRRHYRHLRPVTRAVAIGDVAEYELTAILPDGKVIGPRKEQWELTERGTPANLAEALIGATPGDERRMDLPTELPPAEPGQAAERVTADCRLTICRVLAVELPELDEAFLGRLNIRGGLPELRAAVRRNLESEAAHRLRDRQWKSICACLSREHADFPLPETLVEHTRGTVRRHDMDETAAIDSARRTVREQLVVAEIIRKNRIHASPATVRRLVENAAAGHKDPDAFVAWHYAEDERLRSFRTLALRNAVMDWLLERARLKPVPVPYPALVSEAS